MKRFLIVIFLITNSFFVFDKEEKKFYFEPSFSSQSEALGGTGMIFGEEYGMLYIAPTSLLKNEINYIVGAEISFISAHKQNKENNYISETKFVSNADDNFFLKYSLFLRTLIGNFSGAWYTSIFKNTFPIAYSLEIYNFSLGIGAICNTEFKLFGDNRQYYSTKVSIMYKSAIGSFSILLNNFPIESYSDPTRYFDEILPSKPNLRIGYGKEFETSYLLNKIKFAFEVDNLLMNPLYVNDDKEDYNLFRKIHLGIEFLKEAENVNISLRAGFKNLFPTFGIGLEFRNLFRLEYTFTNRFLGDDLNEKIMPIFIGSIEFKLNNIYYDKWMSDYNNYMNNRKVRNK